VAAPLTVSLPERLHNGRFTSKTTARRTAVSELKTATPLGVLGSYRCIFFKAETTGVVRGYRNISKSQNTSGVGLELGRGAEINIIAPALGPGPVF
jgi:hypothetical protein